MPIQIRTVDGARVPVVHCDQCNQEITRTDDGRVISRGIDIATPHFVHTACEAAFRATQTTVQESMSLGAFIASLNGLAR